MNLRHFTLTLAMPLWAASVMLSPVFAQQIYAAGPYTQNFCPEIRQSLIDRHFRHECVANDTSLNKIEQILAHSHHVALSPFDVVSLAVEDHPDQLTVIDLNLGMKCFYMVTSYGSIDTLYDLSHRIPVALPSADSHTAITFQHLQDIDAQLAQLYIISHYDDNLAAVQSVIDGVNALAFFAEFPDVDNSVVNAASDAGLNFVPVISADILNHDLAGQPLYLPHELIITPMRLLGRLARRDPNSFTTTCTPVVALTNSLSVFEDQTRESINQSDLIQELERFELDSDYDKFFQAVQPADPDRIDAILSIY